MFGERRPKPTDRQTGPSIDFHPIFRGVTSAARSPRLAGWLIRMGERWGRAHVKWAERRLAHRGPAQAIHASRGFLLKSFAQTPRETAAGGSRVWSLGLEESEHEAAVRMSVAGRLFEEGPQAFHYGTVVHLKGGYGGLEIVRGELSVATLHVAQQGDSLFAAPEIKAFSQVPSVDAIRELAPGEALRFDPAGGRIEVEKREHYWPEIEVTTEPYEACQAELKRLLGEGMRKALDECSEEPVLALSGGLDSAIVGHLAREAGLRPTAFTVFLEDGEAKAPPDLAGARQTAATLGLELVEVPIRQDEIDGLVEELIFRIEERRWRDIETGLFVLKLCKTLEAEGRRTILMGSKADNLFVAHVEPDLVRADFEAYRDYLIRRYMMPGMQGKVPAFFGQTVRSPFIYEPLIRFARRLPADYLIGEGPEGMFGKRILRETYGPMFESPLTRGAKQYPLDTLRLRKIFQRRGGGVPRRQKRYDRLRRRLLKPARLGPFGLRWDGWWAR